MTLRPDRTFEGEAFKTAVVGTQNIPIWDVHRKAQEYYIIRGVEAKCGDSPRHSPSPPSTIMPGSLDTDLYDGVWYFNTYLEREAERTTDLYGDNEDNREESTQQVTTQSPVEQKQPAPAEPKQEEKPTTLKKESSLPPKPPTSSELSYSAQVAQQFSAYKQTPAQERQQYQASNASGSKANGASDSASFDDGRRAVRPSEMKDEG